jgi:hypothetical protein
MIGLNSYNCSKKSGQIVLGAGFRRHDFIGNTQHFQVIPTKVGIQIFSSLFLSPGVIEKLKKRNYSAHPVHDHFPALDSGFRRNDVSSYAVFKSVIPAKAGIQSELLLDELSSYKKTALKGWPRNPGGLG